MYITILFFNKDEKIKELKKMRKVRSPLFKPTVTAHSATCK